MAMALSCFGGCVVFSANKLIAQQQQAVSWNATKSRPS
jgi:hypothetical protein